MTLRARLAYSRVLVEYHCVKLDTRVLETANLITVSTCIDILKPNTILENVLEKKVGYLPILMHGEMISNLQVTITSNCT